MALLIVVPALSLLAAAVISLAMLGIAAYSVYEWVRERGKAPAVVLDTTSAKVAA